MMRTAFFVLCLLVAMPAAGQITPTGEFAYPYSILPDSEYNATIPTPESILGFAVGDRAAFPDESVAVFRAMAEASPQAVLFENARTHEGG
jgi:hypothetical protein